MWKYAYELALSYAFIGITCTIKANPNGLALMV